MTADLSVTVFHRPRSRYARTSHPETLHFAKAVGETLLAICNASLVLAPDDPCLPGDAPVALRCRLRACAAAYQREQVRGAVGRARKVMAVKP